MKRSESYTTGKGVACDLKIIRLAPLLLAFDFSFDFIIKKIKSCD